MLYMHFGEYILEKFVSVRAVPELIGGEAGVVVNFLQQSRTSLALTRWPIHLRWLELSSQSLQVILCIIHPG